MRARPSVERFPHHYLFESGDAKQLLPGDYRFPVPDFGLPTVYPQGILGTSHLQVPVMPS